MRSIIPRVDAFLESGHVASPAALDIYRVVLCCYVLTSLPYGLWTADVPEFMYAPPISVVALSASQPPTSLLVAANVVAVASCVVLLAGRSMRAASFVLAGALVAIRSISFAQGKISHDILIVIVPVVLGAVGWGRSAGSGERRPVPISMLAVIIGLWMAAGGLLKLASGWLAPGSSATEYHTIINFFGVERRTALAEFGLDHFPGFVWEAADWGTVAFELLAIVVVWHRRSFLPWLVGATFFHVGILFLLEIDFPTAPMAYLAFAPFDRLPRRVGDALARPAVVAVLGALALAVGLAGASEAVDDAVVLLAPVVAIGFVWSTRRQLVR